ncbi:hypothetical protein PVK64_19695 [Aliivibrio sp. S4TY2]|uniref:hypothetical protein n=1 Tax=unclassified Aliivibrio TaxID=2645654 RepID=UPI002378847E|nr:MULTISPECIES: hypothetical protein [unclassified Aliivibrio]MDD9158392.1 hypothetical protein [Aliivibrio sp. S4TY2]MDD9162392.1 hypothetical protein [Aliivibrio sp. S4TY1]MDD9166399.1 hypothetical protein [Aliivibrio sp. S4MY2]MDD9170397.1 hypothetical protein [Aliivibrio sp. S4MY4]MDD9187493.1 hypothetical protein [Aliivibrio sp. S4MY3]
MDWQEIANIATTAATVIGFISVIVTVVGVWLALGQLKITRKVIQTDFENSIDQQYRQIIQGIPVDILIGQVETPNSETRELIFNYLDLCNEQIYLYSKKRISDERWQDWESGIEDNLKNKAIFNVWQEVKESASFSYLSEFLVTKGI